MTAVGVHLLDAAVDVIADQGLHALTHAAVDAAAGASAGATARSFPTREALVVAVTDHCIERELQMVGPPPDEVSAETLAAMFGRFVTRAVGSDRAVTLARYALQAETARTPSLRPHYAVGADEVDTWAIDLFRRAGSRRPERDFGIVANYATGLVFHELALPTPGLDPTRRVRDLIDALDWGTP